ncbi:hypothetical protein GCM10023221_36540 [Luteimicrobium xylanilyticum]|uniref:DUF4365 domain-containing protein n=1 Tax=Luteimicrobium xylanilyticum TaxID=1133546 RepID=A0A5P9Q8X2_9MICO|nr:DUF4365 domain-containing protein [Luteimicrobium xylanilyticum]QFU97888.1 hypothetical protein KDY119_01394 [Luteimicrobium xylanilyticum]
MSVETSLGSPTHDLFADDIPVSALKERLSKGVIQMIASAAGLDVGEWGTDYDGYDGTIRSIHNFDPYMASPGFDLQLKCTGQRRVERVDHLAWKLDRRTCELLSRPNRALMGAFCVVTVPELPGHWLNRHDEGLLARCHAYYLRGQDIPPVPDGKKSQVLHIPRSNRLDPVSMRDLIEQAARWRWDE